MTTSASPPRGPLHYGLWAAQVFLALSFLAAGGMKATQPLDSLAEMGMTFVPRIPGGLVRFIGVCEVLGAVGLVVPAATGIAPRLTGVAGASLTVLMLFAAFHHVTNGEYALIVPNVVLGGLSAVVAWGRLARMPIPPRG